MHLRQKAQKETSHQMSNQIEAKSITVEEVQALLKQSTGRQPELKAVATILDRVRQRLILGKR